MELITKLILLALGECYERGVLDWHPDDGVPDNFQGECEIVYTSNLLFPGMPGDWHVILFDVFTIIDDEWLYVWHSSKFGEVEV